MKSPLRGPSGRAEAIVGLLASAGAVVFVTAVIAVLKRWMPVLSLGVLYIFAVLPVAVLWGLALACAVSVASMLAFNWFFLPPTHTFQLRDGANWAVLAVYLSTAVVVSALAARARRRAELAEAREREAAARAAAELEAEALRRSDSLKTSLLHAVSHDLRSPLTAIVAAASSLSNPQVTLDDADRGELAATIRDEAERLDRLVGNLLDLSRLRAAAAAPHPELWPADALVARALESLGRRGDRVRVTFEGDPPVVEVDGVQLERVLANVLDNALKFAPPDGDVRLRVESSADSVRIHVENEGPAIADRDRIFEPFHAEGEHGGAGLGLAIARGFVEANGGTLRAEPAEGGAHFVVELPAAVGAPVPA
ncbi:MAG TPA: ATP-binding protein [Gaiellaceae bacterium]|nr:ATP-binding protein [Gaiellaceae bacterium]